MPSGLGMRPMSLLTPLTPASRKARLRSEDQIYLIERTSLDQINLIFAASPLPGRRPKELLVKWESLLDHLTSVARMRSLYYHYIIDVLAQAEQEKTHVSLFCYFSWSERMRAITREEEELATTTNVNGSQLALLIIDYHRLWAPRE